MGTMSLITSTYDNSLSSNQEKLYVNGVLNASQSATGTLTSMVSLTIGSYLSGGGGHNYTGAIDNLRIYNRALSAAEVQQLYQGTL